MLRDPRQTRNNQLILREVNERIAEITVQQKESRSEFVCECGWMDCNDHVDFDLGAYRAIRASGDYFIAATGHCVDGVDKLAESRNGFDVLAQL
jgi:hypothetical protein